MTAYVVETTAAGTAAIAVLEVVGPDAMDAIARAFGPCLLGPNRPLHTMIADGDGELDDVVLAFRPPEESMTGWPHVEIQCHGSPAIVKRVRRALVAVGVKPAPRTFLLRTAVRNRRMTRLEEEAWLAAMSAHTERAANELFEQRKRLPALAGKIGDTRDRELLVRLIKVSVYGCALAIPRTIVVVGRPNSGKSSIVNALAGRERVLVDCREGTTRDLVRISAAIEGVPIQLVDTAGLRDSDDAVERDGVEMTRSAVRSATTVLHVVDATNPFPHDPLPPTRHAISVWNKVDVMSPSRLPAEAIGVSATTGQGLDELAMRILKSIGADRRQDVEGTFLFKVRQLNRAVELSHASDAEWRERWERWVWGRARH
mgnify:FL=1